MFRLLVLAFLSMALSGCASLKGQLENIVVCGLPGEAYIISKYGPLGLSSEVAERYAQAYCARSLK